MNTQRIAKGWALIAEGAMELSLAYESIESPAPVRAGEAGADQVVSPQPASAPDLPRPAAREPESAFTRCPAHNRPWDEGKYGKYCQAHSDDYPDWANDKGFCRVTPKSAGAWLAQHPRVAA